MVLKKKLISQSSKPRGVEQEARIRNDRQAVFQIVRDLVQAQFNRGDEELTRRLWQDVADREIDLDRVINLMYSCSFHEDDNEMTINGVEIQCAKQSEHVNTPNKSELFVKNLIYLSPVNTSLLNFFLFIILG